MPVLRCFVGGRRPRLPLTDRAFDDRETGRPGGLPHTCNQLVFDADNSPLTAVYYGYEKNYEIQAA